MIIPIKKSIYKDYILIIKIIKLGELMKIITNFEISKGYSVWKEAFVKNEPMRQKHTIKTLAYGHEEGNENNVYSVLEIPSMETMQELLKEPEMIELRENAGVVFETQKMTKLVE